VSAGQILLDGEGEQRLDQKSVWLMCPLALEFIAAWRWSCVTRSVFALAWETRAAFRLVM